MFEFDRTNPILDVPAYSLADTASYARVPYQTLRYWVQGRGDIPRLINPPDSQPLALSFLNLLECHVLNALRTKYELRIKAVRRGLETLARFHQSKHPLLEAALSTDKIDLFLEHAGDFINLSRGGQTAMREVLLRYVQRIECNDSGIPKFFPFVYRNRPEEPKIVSIIPTVAFGRSVIDGTGISTAVVASRFNAREPISELAKEYGRTEREIQEAIIWEANRTAKAA